VLPIDLSTLPLGGVRYSLLLDANGGILDDLMVTRWGTGFYLVVNGATKHDDIAHLRANLPEAVSLTHLATARCWRCKGRKPSRARSAGGWRTRAFRAQLHARRQLHAGRRGRVDQPLGLYRRGRVRDRRADAAAIADLICAQPQVKPIGLGARDRCGWKPACRSTGTT
jgi:aminomethyltransferase